MSSAESTAGVRRAVERHYDSLALLYRIFWGEHIHHGLWPGRRGSPRAAQVRLVAHLARCAEIRRGDRVLDVGCGYGAPARWLASRLDCPVTGITISRKQARLANDRNRRHDLDGVTLVRADAAALPFADGAFDVVWVVECMEHVVDKRGFIERASRALRRGGRLAVCTWQRGEGHGGEELVARVCEAFLCPSLATAAEHREWCLEAGLRVRHQEDLTSDVKATWRILQERVGRPWVKPLRFVVGRDIRRFVDGFPAIAEAYESGALRYGVVVADRS